MGATRHSVAATAAAPMGRLIRNTPRQLKLPAISPPNTGPSPEATPVTAPQTPKAMPRSLPV